MTEPQMVGRVFGKLTVVGYDLHKCVCACSCGGTKTVVSYNLLSGNVKSCGCLQKRRRTREGEVTLRAKWCLMINRCHKEGSQAYKAYGARGIRVCDEWRNSFDAFYDFSIEAGWKPGLQIDRIDNNAGYSPENCRYITLIENCRSTRNSRTWVVEGKEYSSLEQAAAQTRYSTATISKWCRQQRPGYDFVFKYTEFDRRLPQDQRL